MKAKIFLTAGAVQAAARLSLGLTGIMTNSTTLSLVGTALLMTGGVLIGAGIVSWRALTSGGRPPHTELRLPH
jgi:hypothetical protein